MPRSSRRKSSVRDAYDSTQDVSDESSAQSSGRGSNGSQSGSSSRGGRQLSGTNTDLLHPWLGTWARMSLAWVSTGIFPIITLAVSLILVYQELDNAVVDGKKKVQDACSGLDQMASYATSMPHYLSQGTNLAMTKAVSNVLENAASSIDVSLQALEGLINFMLQAILAPMLCIFEFFAKAALMVLEDALKAVDTAVEASAKGIGDAVTAGVSGINDAITKFDKSVPFGLGKIPTISVNLGALQHVHLDLADDVAGLSNKIPTVQSIVSKLTSLVDKPIEALRTDLKTLIGKIDVNVDMLPVPAKQSANVCADVNGGFVDTLANDLRIVILVVLWALVAATVILAITLAVRAWWEYKLELSYVEGTRQNFFPEDESNPPVPSTSSLLAFYEASKSPAVSLALGSQATTARKSWFINFVTHQPAVVFFYVGALGILVIELQLMLLNGAVREKAAALVTQAVSEFGTAVRDSVNGHLNATSTQYSNDVNGVVNGVSGKWDSTAGDGIQKVTKFMNDTINTVNDQITDVIHDILGTGPYATDVQNLIYCLIGSKVALFQDAITWINKNVNLTFPQVSQDVFMISDSQSDAMVAQVVGGNSSTNSSLHSGINTFLDNYQGSLETSRWLYSPLLLRLLRSPLH